MSNGDWLVVLIVGLICVVLSLAAFSDGKRSGVKQTQREAVKHGAAEYVADKDGNVEFKWKTPSSNKP